MSQFRERTDFRGNEFRGETRVFLLEFASGERVQLRGSPFNGRALKNLRVTMNRWPCNELTGHGQTRKCGRNTAGLAIPDLNELIILEVKLKKMKRYGGLKKLGEFYSGLGFF